MGGGRGMTIKEMLERVRCLRDELHHVTDDDRRGEIVWEINAINENINKRLFEKLAEA
jgi:hypothetical protein